MKFLDKIIDSKKTVFTYKDIELILWILNKNTIKSFFYRAKKIWFLKNIYKWLYTLKDFNKNELFCKLKKNSYISFETVLKEESVIFQYYWNNIFLASNNTWEKKILEYAVHFFKIKDDILYNPLWLINKWNYTIATAERAICDIIYIAKDYYFDNLEWINKNKLIEISKIYNKRVVLKIQELIKNI